MREGLVNRILFNDKVVTQRLNEARTKAAVEDEQNDRLMKKAKKMISLSSEVFDFKVPEIKDRLITEEFDL